MTYAELLKITEDEKKKLKAMERTASKNKVMKAVCEKDIKKLPNILALFFLDKLSDNFDSIIESVDDEYAKQDLTDLYMRYEDMLGGTDTEISIDELPTEAMYS